MKLIEMQQNEMKQDEMNKRWNRGKWKKMIKWNETILIEMKWNKVKWNNVKWNETNVQLLRNPKHIDRKGKQCLNAIWYRCYSIWTYPCTHPKDPRAMRQTQHRQPQERLEHDTVYVNSTDAWTNHTKYLGICLCE